MIKRRIMALVLSASALTAATLAVNPAFAWRGGGFGGFHGGDEGGFHADSFHGPDGADATMVRGPDGGVGAVAHGPNGGWHAGGVGGYGGTWHADGYHGGGYWGGYHGPAVVNSYYGGGCYACAGAAVGLAAVGAYAIGASLATLPSHCSYRIVDGEAFYVCGGTWLNPRYGANGLYYQVVPPL